MPIEREEIRLSALRVRDEEEEISWAVFGYDEMYPSSPLNVLDEGSDYTEFLEHFTDDARVFGYVALGEEHRKRCLLIVWLGPNVSPLKKAKVSPDKAEVRNAVEKKFVKEIVAEDKSILEYDNINNILSQAVGAHYGD